MVLSSHPLGDLISTNTNVCIVQDNAKSHAPLAPVVAVPVVGICRWQSSPVLPTKAKLFPSLKRSSSVPTTSASMIPSLTSLVAPTRRRSLDGSSSSSNNNERRSASQLLSEYLRLSTEEISLIDIDGDDYHHQEEEDEIMFPATTSTTTEETLSIATRLSFGMVAAPEKSPSLTSNVKKPVRRKSLDGSSSTTKC